jgi:excisionase family DNA binding protein
MRTIQVAERLGLTVHQVMHLVHEHGIQIPKEGGRFAWTEEAVEELRAALREREARREPPRHGLSSREAAERLGISYSRLIDLVRERQIPVPRIGPSQVFDFDEASLERVREILAQPPAPPRRSGLMTIPVVRKGFQASLPELALVTEGQTRQEALRLMRKRLWARYREVSAAPGSAADEWTALQQIIVPR